MLVFGIVLLELCYCRVDRRALHWTQPASMDDSWHVFAFAILLSALFHLCIAQALTWALERGRASIAAAANVSGEDGVSGSRRPAQRGPFGPEPPKRREIGPGLASNMRFHFAAIWALATHKHCLER